jgi:hypothetical protein
VLKPSCKYWDAATVRLSIAIFVYYVTKMDLRDLKVVKRKCYGSPKWGPRK